MRFLEAIKYKKFKRSGHDDFIVKRKIFDYEYVRKTFLFYERHLALINNESFPDLAVRISIEDYKADDWEVEQETVDFLTALQSGKEFRSELDDDLEWLHVDKDEDSDIFDDGGYIFGKRRNYDQKWFLSKFILKED